MIRFRPTVAGLFPALMLIALFVIPHASIKGDDVSAMSVHNLAELSAETKAELVKKKERFDQLSTEEKQRMAKLHAALDDHPDKVRLRETMLRYTDWLSTLSAAQRAELGSLSPAERIKQIETLRNKQEAERFAEIARANLKPDDIRALFFWLGDFALARKELLLSGMPRELRERYNRASPAEQRRMLIMALQRLRPRTGRLSPTADDIARLEATLSPEAAAVLRNSGSDQQKKELVAAWLRAAIASRFRPQISDEQLRQFAATRLTNSQREEIDGLPREQMQARLRELYYAERIRRGGAVGIRPDRPNFPLKPQRNLENRNP